ncbi:adenylate/guanylate cyclase domain-containing protein [Sneathiella sp. P13V-1]|uniref:adenylate/guanylate cyclase domain-containing protein n=1 Tax=Sneathiella sp. P13V-1 TaxID=2697366 RepID=UPI00187B6878|nr:adenylate/guanylate cyclase domain-containing protein [Sneathiella sp. P13V-1]MBE7636656.1 adenylate/guanylate cyclase domain-containing protein [Sneathiella sp. P13V-1]
MVDAVLPKVSERSDKEASPDELASNQFLEEALKENKREGLVLAVKARTIALSVVGVFLFFMVGDWSFLYYEALIGAFMLNGYAQLKLGRVGRSRIELLLLALDLALMTVTLVVPNPFSHQDWTVALQYRISNFSYFYILLAGAALAYSWKTMFAVTWYTALLWAIAYYWAIQQPGFDTYISEQISELLGHKPEILELLHPDSNLLHMRFEEILIFAIVAGILALNSWRSNRLLMRQAEAARERANLARYFAPSMVEHLAGRDHPLRDVRSQSVVVMFVDIVGFTKMAETASPNETVMLLREFHNLMEKAVFDNNGTLDKFLGDGLMVTFGTPIPSKDDAKNAINCVLQMQTDVKSWNEKRKSHGLPEVKASIGVHAGEVVLGDIGSERRLEFAVLGDAVNVCSRLEALTRELAVKAVVSSAVVEQAGGSDFAVEKGFAHHGPVELRGRNEAVDIWTRRD